MNTFKELKDKITKLDNENYELKRKIDIANKLNYEMWEKLRDTIETNTQLERLMRKE